MTTAQLFFGITSWLIGFVSAIGANYLLERRRAFRAVIGACHSVESRMTDDANFPEFHRWSIEVLEAAFFAGVGFLNAEDQKRACDAWGSYHSFDVTRYPDEDFLGSLKVFTGGASATKPAAMRIEIEKIRSIFSKFP